MPDQVTIHYVPSTHWDREWYQEFQGFRYRLVKLVDKLLDILDRHPDYRQFTFDGQTVCLEDYLEIRPEMREKLTRHIQSGRILIGPWYTMPDERILSGESLLRNLLAGHQVARTFQTTAMKYGYICDIFGHIAQMPQLFHRSDIPFALLGRGTNESTQPADFLWRSPDGSTVLTFKLPDDEGYGMACNFHRAAEHADDSPEAREKVMAEAKKLYAAERQRTPFPVQLWLDGVDHLEPSAAILPALKEVAKKLKVKIKFSTLPDYAQEVAQYRDQMPTCDGELIKTAKAKIGGSYLYLISHCLSSYYPLKHANDVCQDLLTRWAEPFYVQAQTAGRAPAPGYLRVAWKYLLKNHAHDSICGCSIQQVHQDMVYRFAQARTIANNLLQDFYPARDDHGDTLTLFSNLPFARRTVATAEIPASAIDSKFSLTGFSDDQVPCFTLRDASGQIVPYQLENYRTPLSLLNHADIGNRKIKIRVAAEFDGLGSRSFTLEPARRPQRDLNSMLVAPLTAENQFLRVAVNPDGSLTLTDRQSGQTFANQLQFEDTAEIGDGWFHVKPVDNATFYSAGGKTEIAVVEDGSLAVSFRIEKTMALPEALDWSMLRRSDVRRDFRIVTTVTLKKDTPRLECQVQIQNNVADHRLRVLFPTGIAGKTYFSAQPFAVVTRSRGIDRRTADWKEADTEERNFCDFIGVHDRRRGLALLAGHGLHEIAVKDDEAGTMALTLFRSFKRTVMTTGEPGGELLDQTMTFAFALQPFTGTPDYRKLMHATEDFTQEVRSVCWKKNTADQTFFRLEKDQALLSALKPAADQSGAAILRVYNLSDKPVVDQAVFAKNIATVREVNLVEEQPGVKLPVRSGRFGIKLSPWQIAAYRIEWKA